MVFQSRAASARAAHAQGGLVPEQHPLTKLREESTTASWRTIQFFGPKASTQEAHTVLKQKVSEEARTMLSTIPRRRVALGMPPLRSGKKRQGSFNEEKMSHYLWNLLDGTIGALNALDADPPVVEDLRDLVMNYCGYARPTDWCQDERYFLSLSQVEHCLAVVRDEIHPLAESSDSWE